MFGIAEIGGLCYSYYPRLLTVRKTWIFDFFYVAIDTKLPIYYIIERLVNPQPQ